MNAFVDKLEPEVPQMEQWFEHMHRHPELSMHEAATAEFIAEQLRRIGVDDIATGIGKHGIVATLTAGDGVNAIGLRADFDALPIEEQDELPYKSTVPGVAHVCGHDGHATMLLGAASYLARTRNFNGTVRLIFQPGEETMEGAPAMIRDGLFERFPVDRVFGMHNIPELDEGKLYFRPGETMASVDNWEIGITGKGGHGGMPELAIDPIVAGASIVMAIQTIVSRNVAPAHRAVITIGAFQAGNAGNVVANSAVLRLSVRTTMPEDREMVLGNIRRIVAHQSASFGCESLIREGVPGAVLVNDQDETEKAAAIARKAFGDDNVICPGPAFLASEDFAFMLQEKKGTYCFVGGGPGKMVHHPEYRFNKAILPVGAAYWVALVEHHLQ